MSNPYAQVALTYIRRPFSSWLAGFFVIAFVANVNMFLLFCASGASAGRGVHVMASQLIMVAFWPALLATHVKEQFAAPRSHLLPNFRRVHIIVAAAVTLIFAVVDPAIVTWLFGLRSVGLVAVTVLVFGVVFWCVLVQSGWLALPVTVLILATYSEAANGWLRLLVSGQSETQAVGLLALGAAIIVAAGMRLLRLNEDMPEYHRQMGWAGKGYMTGQNVNYDGLVSRTLIDRLRERTMARLTRHVQSAAQSTWSRICRWRVGMPMGWQVLTWGLLPAAFLFFTNWGTSRHAHGTAANDGTTDWPVSSLFFVVILTAAQLLPWLRIRTRTMAHELMLPVARWAYVEQLLVAMAVSYFQVCGVTLASTILCCYTAVATPPPVDYVVSAVAAALLLQTAMFGIMVFVHSVTCREIRHTPTRTAIVAGLLLLSVASVLWVIGLVCLTGGGEHAANFEVMPGILAVSVAAAALGALLFYIAYRRLLVADFN